MYSSKIFEQALEQLSSLPSIGTKTATRLIFHLLQQQSDNVQALAQSLIDLKEKIYSCKHCHNLSDTPVCSICDNPERDHSTICVVEQVRDVIAIENTRSYRGLYHILGGLIAPLDNIGPDKLHIAALIARLQAQPVKELIFALSPNMQGDTTIFYIQKKIAPFFQAPITIISRGIAFGAALEYADEFTLSQALSRRLPIENYMGNASA